MAARGRSRTSSEGVRVRHLISLDAALVMKRLVERKEEMVSLFSRLRDRTPMTETLRSAFDTIRFTELALLAPREQLGVHHFYDLLDQLRWYVRYTEDMPSKVLTFLSLHVRLLEGAHHKLEALLGPATGEAGPVVEVAPSGQTALLGAPVAKASRRKHGPT